MITLSTPHMSQRVHYEKRHMPVPLGQPMRNRFLDNPAPGRKPPFAQQRQEGKTLRPLAAYQSIPMARSTE